MVVQKAGMKRRNIGNDQQLMPLVFNTNQFHFKTDILSTRVVPNQNFLNEPQRSSCFFELALKGFLLLCKSLHLILRKGQRGLD